MRNTILALFGVGLALAACGDPTPTNRFEFTPVAYTVVPTSATPPGEILVVDDGKAGFYVANEVLATVGNADEADFSAWAAGVGFERIRLIELLSGEVMVVLRVPPGSVDDAIEFIRAERQDVIEADRNVLATGNSQ